MTTLNEMIEIIKIENPVLKRGNDEDGYVELDKDEYAATIKSWAEARLDQETKEAKAQASKEIAIAKLAALGLDLDDLKSLGF